MYFSFSDVKFDKYYNCSGILPSRGICDPCNENCESQFDGKI